MDRCAEMLVKIDGEEGAFQKARDYRAEMEEEWRVRQGGLKLPS